MGVALVMKAIVSYCQGNVVFAIHFTVKAVYPAVHYTNKMKCFSFKSGHALRVAKLIKEDWFIVLQ